MAPPVGAFQRAFLVAVPLALIVLIFVTPTLIGRQQSPTTIPVFSAGVAKAPWNATYNETALLYVRSGLGTAMYNYVAINLTGLGNYSGTGWSINGTRVPSLWLKYPVNATRIARVAAIAIDDFSIYRYNATVEYRWVDRGWTLAVIPEGQSAATEYREGFSVAMGREARR